MSDQTDKLSMDSVPNKPAGHPLRRLLIVAVPLAVFVTLLFVVLFVLGNNSEEPPASAAPAQPDQPEAITRLQGSVQDLEQRLGSLSDLNARVASMEQRLSEVNAQLDQQSGAIDVENMSHRMEALEGFLEEARRQIDMQLTALEEVVSNRLAEASVASQQAEEPEPSPSPAKPRTASRPAIPRLPLHISGVEYRGGRPYLSVATGPVNDLDQVRLLGERESVGEWQLVTINASTAVFRYRGQNVTVNLP
ncbi:hypothetical protein [Chromohalobacter israelensis]|uniref:hypothetical protein n=1 Tax=Chromohalobacter israelensis TaxID=141390 RepID=UPI0012EC41D6|nr:hypothetical protein [Chromohalobacter israelensis]MDF9434657.1 hypothetical protein [Chromohalobacter israelensis]